VDWLKVKALSSSTSTEKQSIAFLSTNNEQAEKETKMTIPFII
jgi:hypothetical protein